MTDFLATSITDSLLTAKSQSRCCCCIISEMPLRNNVDPLLLGLTGESTYVMYMHINAIGIHKVITVT